MPKPSYEDFRFAIVRYASESLPDERMACLNAFADGLLEYLVASHRLDPHEFEGWPEDGLVAPLLRDAEEASA